MASKKYTIPGAPKGASITVTAPAKLVGVWRFALKWPGARTLRNTARMYCGADRRLKMKWDKNLGAGVMAQMTAAADRRLAEIAGKAKVCR